MHETKEDHASYTTLTMVRQFDVKPERLFDAWINPQMMRKWLMTMEATNKVATCDPRVGGTWEIVDVRDGVEYRAIGEYLEVDPPHKLVLTFRMPQFNDSVDTLTVKIKPLGKGCEMVFTQVIRVPHEEGWREAEIARAMQEYHDGSQHGWNLMFVGLQQLLKAQENEG
jgi:uncharacterized protein YndB with AHSA1/START domain